MTDNTNVIEGEILDAQTTDETQATTGVDLIVAMPEGTNNVEDIFRKDKIDDLTNRIREEAERQRASGEFDIDTKEGRAAVKTFARKVASAKNRLMETGTAMTKDLRDKVKVINGQRDGAVDTLQKLQDEIRKPLTDWEEKDAARKEAHEEAIKAISDTVTGFNHLSDPADIEAAVTKLIHTDTGDKFEEFEGKATKAKNDAIEHLGHTLEQAQTRVEQEQAKAEAERVAREAEEAKAKAEEEARKAREETERLIREAEEAKQKAEREIQAAKDEAERIKREAAEAAEKAERERKEAAEKAERDRLQAIQDEKDRVEREKREAEAKAQRDKEEAERREREKEEAAQRAKEQAEREQREKEERERQEREQREADERLRAGILSEITAALKDVKKADIPQALMDGKIPHVTVNF